MRFLFTVAIALFVATPVSAQEMSVPPVTTASPGGYANPLKLDTDRYARNGSSAKSAPFGLCNARPLTQARRASLEAGYLSRARVQEIQGFRWLRDQCGPNEAWRISQAAKRRVGIR